MQLLPGTDAASRRRALHAALFIVLVAALSAAYAYVKIARIGFADFIWAWRGGQVLLAGGDPYAYMNPGAPPPFSTGFYYPLTAAIVGIPFSWASLPLGGALFVATSAALLAYGLLRAGESHRLPLFLSVPYLAAISQAQWAPLLMAAVLVPGIGWLLAVKPHVGAALFLRRPRWSTAIACAAFLALALALDPRWPLKWLGVVRHSPYHRSPILALPLGPLLLLAALRWRRPEARLLLVLACVPQYAGFYDTLPLFLVTRTRRQSWALVAAGWLTLLATGVVHDRAMLMQLGLYFPALACVLSGPRAAESETTASGDAARPVIGAEPGGTPRRSSAPA